MKKSTIRCNISNQNLTIMDSGQRVTLSTMPQTQANPAVPEKDPMKEEAVKQPQAGTGCKRKACGFIRTKAILSFCSRYRA